MRFTWLTDIHPYFLEERDRLAFYQRVSNDAHDAVLIGEGIGEANTVRLPQGDTGLSSAQHFFVLENRNYYGGSISQVREAIGKRTRGSRRLRDLPDIGAVLLQTARLK
jgi:hypothetical protein